MSAGYLPAVREVFPNTKQTIDQFHVKQVPLKALDVRYVRTSKTSPAKKGAVRTPQTVHGSGRPHDRQATDNGDRFFEAV